MAYRHGIYVSEIPTAIVPPVSASAGLPVVFGTAPVNLAADPTGITNVPTLCYTYQEAVAAFGYSKDWEKYTLCEFMKSQFALYAVGPVVFINVLDPAVHKKEEENTNIAMAKGVAKIKSTGVLLASLVVKLTEAGQPLVKDTDYTAAFNDEAEVIVTRIEGGDIPEPQASILCSYTDIDPSAVDTDDIIGGIDIATGDPEGLELVNRVFPLFRLIPGQIVAPGWSHHPAVAAVMTAKAGNINGHFKAIAVTDADSSSEGADQYTKVAAWKNDNNYMSPRQIVCWPKVKLGDDHYHLSTQAAGRMCLTDFDNSDVPYKSPSNKSIQANGAMVASGKAVALDPEQAAYLNGQGIVTALNFIGGWKLWGNRTGVYPASSDPKDAFIPVRRMFDWIGNTLTQTFWSKIDEPTNRLLIDTVMDSANIWFNGLAARKMILGGRVEFLSSENPTTDLIDGIIKFHVYVMPPGPAREMDFIMEYDVNYMSTLFE